MRLLNVRIDGFRSIGTTELRDCNGFNVLIGKNNSGKSTILSAIEAFFATFSKKEVLHLKPQIGRVTDFHNRDISKTLTVGATFQLALAERDALVHDIVKEFPQVQNAVDGLDPALQLFVCLSFLPPPERVAYVNCIALRQPQDTTPSHVLLDLPEATARAMIGHAQELEQSRTMLQALRSIAGLTRDDWRRTRQTSSTRPVPNPPFDYFIRDVPPDLLIPSVMERVQQLYREATDPTEFYEAVRQVIQTEDAHEQSLSAQERPERFKTFAGETTSIPAYITNLLARLSAVKVLHLTESRKQMVEKKQAVCLT